ncbi:hypothetical protein B0T25DRAFT_627895, partial [Lasiosphaeria hispida]
MAASGPRAPPDLALDDPYSFDSSDFDGFSDSHDDNDSGASDSESDASGASDSEVPEPLSNPPPSHRLFTHQYDSFDDLFSELNAWAAAAGFQIRKLRSNNYVKGFGASRIDIGCRQDKIRKSRAISHPTTTTIKRGCTWELVAKALQKNQRKWTLEPVPGREIHTNHPPMDPQFATVTKFRPEFKAFIAQYVDRPAVSNRELLIDMRKQFPSVVFDSKKIRKWRHRLKKLARGGYTPFQTAMKMLDKEGINYLVKWDPEDNTKPTGLFWTNLW